MCDLQIPAPADRSRVDYLTLCRVGLVEDQSTLGPRIASAARIRGTNMPPAIQAHGTLLTPTGGELAIEGLSNALLG